MFNSFVKCTIFCEFHVAGVEKGERERERERGREREREVRLGMC